MEDAGSTIRIFLDATAARQPAPGGGAAAALAGALAAATGEMVLNYSVGKKSLAEYDAQLRGAVAELTRARRMMLELMVEDQVAYEAMTKAQKLPDDAPDRNGVIDAALLTAIRVPQAISATAVAILEICNRIAGCANVHLLSDLAVCADLAMATVRCATHSARVNLKVVREEADRQSLEAANARMLAHGVKLVQSAQKAIASRS